MKQASLQCSWISRSCSVMGWVLRRPGDLERGRFQLWSSSMEIDTSRPSSRQVSKVRELSISFFLKAEKQSKKHREVYMRFAYRTDNFSPVCLRNVLQISTPKSLLFKKCSQYRSPCVWETGLEGWAEYLPSSVVNIVNTIILSRSKFSNCQLVQEDAERPVDQLDCIFHNLINKVLMIGLIALSFLACFATAKIDMQIGAGGAGFGCGSNSPAAQVPYSFVRLGPDTAPLLRKEYFKFQHFGGYNTADHYLRAFSHMHLVGAGVQDMGIFGVLPLKSNGKKPSIPKDPLLLFYKESQKAQPGYYRADLQNDITAELTTTQRTGAHRYTFKRKGTHNINIMTGYLLDKQGKRNSTTLRCGQRCLEGSVTVLAGFGGRFGGYTAHFHLQWESDGQDRVYLFNNTSIDESITSASSQLTGAIIQTNSSLFHIYIGISYVSTKNAQLNLQAQVPLRNFDKIRTDAQGVWKQQLSRFQVAAVSEEYQTKFDTALYRTMLTPTLFNDANGEYLSFRNDGSVSKVPSDMKAVYTDMSIWDVHRTQMPWILFHDLERYNDIAKSLLLINREGGYMPKWPFAQGWTGCMIGAHANTILADWVVKEASRRQLANITEIMGYMLRNANTQTPHDSRPNPAQYIQKGYIPFEQAKTSSVSETLELSTNDFSISQVAALLNMTQTRDDFLNRSTFYRNLWNKETRFFDPKFSNGTFFKISSRQRLNSLSKYYVEGDAWHYRFAVPHDAEGLIELFGGHQPFIKELNKFFRNSKFWPTFWLPNPYYWAGNEHDLFSVWLFSFAGRPDLTAKYSRMILDKQYGLGGDGLPGNDDYATMSAWFIWGALGLYPLPSTQTYILGSPVISSARIYRKMGNNTLLAVNINAAENRPWKHEVESVNLGGRPLDRFVTHSMLSQPNSVLSFVMG